MFNFWSWYCEDIAAYRELLENLEGAFAIPLNTGQTKLKVFESREFENGSNLTFSQKTRPLEGVKVITLHIAKFQSTIRLQLTPTSMEMKITTQF